MSSIGLMLLAAGASSRLGRPKQTLIFQGRTLLERAIETALASDCRPVLVVTGASAEVVEALAAGYPVSVARNPDWLEGMNASIRAGLQALATRSETLDAVIIMTCDQPFLSPTVLNELIRVYRVTGRPIAACEYAGTRGVPALFDRALFPELLRLPAGAGAGRLIAKRPPEQVAAVAFPDGAIDIDTPEEAARLIL